MRSARARGVGPRVPASARQCSIRHHVWPERSTPLLRRTRHRPADRSGAAQPAVQPIARRRRTRREPGRQRHPQCTLRRRADSEQCRFLEVRPSGAPTRDLLGRGTPLHARELGDLRLPAHRTPRTTPPSQSVRNPDTQRGPDATPTTSRRRDRPAPSAHADRSRQRGRLPGGRWQDRRTCRPHNGQSAARPAAVDRTRGLLSASCVAASPAAIDARADPTCRLRRISHFRESRERARRSRQGRPTAGHRRNFV